MQGLAVGIYHATKESNMKEKRLQKIISPAYGIPDKSDEVRVAREAYYAAIASGNKAAIRAADVAYEAACKS